MNAVNDYVSAVARALGSDNIKKLLKLDNELAQLAVYNLSKCSPAQVNGSISRKLQKPWDTIIQVHLEALNFRNNGQQDDASNAYIANGRNPLEMLIEAVKAEPQALWLVGAVDQVLHNSTQLAKEADSKAMKKTQQTADAQLLTAVLPTAGNPKTADKPAQSRVYILLLIAKFKALYNLNSIQQCVQMERTIKAAINSASGQGLADYPVSYKVTLCYYLGRATLYDERLAEAEQMLSLAFQMCSRAFVSHKRAILRYLVPVKMLLGQLPADELLDQYQLQLYLPVKEALYTGNVGLLQRTLDEHRLRMVQQGTFLIVEKLLWACYRRLIKRVHAYHAQVQQDKPHQLPLGLVLGVLQSQGVSTDMEQLECMLSNLIVRGYVKGYISHASKVMVVAKEGAYPPPSEKWLAELVF
jgi:hypothetical protein